MEAIHRRKRARSVQSSYLDLAMQNDFIPGDAWWCRKLNTKPDTISSIRTRMKYAGFELLGNNIDGWEVVSRPSDRPNLSDHKHRAPRPVAENVPDLLIRQDTPNNPEDHQPVATEEARFVLATLPDKELLDLLTIIGDALKHQGDLLERVLPFLFIIAERQTQLLEIWQPQTNSDVV